MAANTARLRPPPINVPTRELSPNSTDSDDSDNSPDQERDEEAAFFLTHANDSQSTICPPTGAKGDAMDIDTDQRHRLTPISKLPPELLIAIFSKLTTTTDLRNCMLVSYHWALYSVSILWHRPLCNKWLNLQHVARTLAELRPTFPYHEMVKRLNLSAVADKVNDGTAQAFMNCKGIERLTLTSCLKLTDFGVAGLVAGSHRLQALDVTEVDALTDRTMLVVAKTCAKLQGLNITNCSNVTDESLLAIAENCRQLKRLKLNGVFRATDRSVIAVARHCRSILEIDLAGCEFITSESVTALLMSLPYLRELRLAQCTDITDSAFTNLPPKMHCDALRILDLTQCEQVHDDAIARIIPAAPRLRNLVLAKCRHITDRAVDAICKLTKNLHYIHLGHCTNLTDAAVINLVKHCNRIRYIDLACCSKLTDASVRHLAQLPRLRRIGLVKCQNLTDNSILALAHGPLVYSSSAKQPVPSQLVSLERVHLSYCTNLTLKAFLRDDLTRFCREAPSEFTHPQRDVFCVFSGDGVKNLKDYLTRLAVDEAEREHQNAIEENLLDPDDSPGADTMSEDGTIDGNDHSGDVIYGPGRYGFPSVTGARRPLRPRSMQNLHSQNGYSLPLDPHQIHHSAPWTPGGPVPELRSNLGSPHLSLMNTGSLNLPEADLSFPTGTLGHMPLPPFDFDRLFREAAPSHNQTRRHTLESAAFYTPPSPGHNASPANPSQSHDVSEDSRIRTPPSGMLPTTPRMASSPVSGSTPRTESAQMPTRLQPRSEAYPPPSPLRPDPEFSAFEANHEAIMSTIPNNGALGALSSHTEGSHASRAATRHRLGDLLGTMRALSSTPLSYADFTARSSRSSQRREITQHRSDTHREAIRRTMLAAEQERHLWAAASRASADDVGEAAAATGTRERVVGSTTTSRSSSQPAEPRVHTPSQAHEEAQDIDMTQ